MTLLYQKKKKKKPPQISKQNHDKNKAPYKSVGQQDA